LKDAGIDSTLLSAVRVFIEIEEGKKWSITFRDLLIRFEDSRAGKCAGGD